MNEAQFKAWWYDFCVKNNLGSGTTKRLHDVAWQAYKAGYESRTRDSAEEKDDEVPG